MAAPRHIVDSLECVISVFFSSVRHNLRAAFILCDELVEVTCKAKAKQKNPKLGKINFFDLLKHQDVALDSKTTALGGSLFASHQTRNNLQHENPAATVDVQHCADAILDAVQAIEHCFPGTTAALNFPPAIRVAMRVTRLLSSQGDLFQRSAFKSAMHDHGWRIEPKGKLSKQNEVIINPGEQDHWGIALFRDYAAVEKLLDKIGVPP